MAKLNESTIKKKDWEDWLAHWSKLQHPIVPGKESISRYKMLISKYFPATIGKKALQLGATWQTRDMLAELGFEVTVVDISEKILQFHTKMCKVKKRNEKLIVDDWLKFTSKDNEKFDLVIGDAANFQFREESYPQFFTQVASWLKPEGFSIQLIESNHKDTSVPIKEFVKFLKDASDEQLDDYRMKAYYYLSTSVWKNSDRFGNVASIEAEIKPFLEGNIYLAEKWQRFSLHLNSFSACLLPVKKVDAYITKHLDIIERIPFGSTYVEEAFYWLYVMKSKP